MALVNRGASTSRGRVSTSSNASNSSRKNSLGLRRRSSFGGAMKISMMPTNEQLRITDMYKTVIKLSSENVCILCCNIG